MRPIEKPFRSRLFFDPSESPSRARKERDPGQCGYWLFEGERSRARFVYDGRWDEALAEAVDAGLARGDTFRLVKRWSNRSEVPAACIGRGDDTRKGRLGQMRPTEGKALGWLVREEESRGVYDTVDAFEYE